MQSAEARTAFQEFSATIFVQCSNTSMPMPAQPTAGMCTFKRSRKCATTQMSMEIRVKWKLGSDCGADAACYAKDVDSLAGTGRTWIILSHVLIRDKSDDRAILLEELDKRGRRLEEFSTHSAHAYLYDLGGDKR